MRDDELVLNCGVVIFGGFLTVYVGLIVWSELAKRKNRRRMVCSP